MKFEDLKEGLHSPPTRIKMEVTERYYNADWTGFVMHEIIYVNVAKKEIVYQAFSKIDTMTDEQFESRGYTIERESNERN